MNKNPFEVRLDIMKMAQEMLDKEHDLKMKKFVETIDVMKSSNTRSAEIQNYINASAPQMYSEKDIVSKANELYNFVNTSSSARSK